MSATTAPRRCGRSSRSSEGLSSTVKQKEVTAGLSGMYLRDLVSDGDLDDGAVGRLLAAMKLATKAPKPAALGVIGEAHIRAWMTRHAGVSEGSIRYVKRLGENGLPHVVEVAFGVREGDDQGRRS